MISDFIDDATPFVPPVSAANSLLASLHAAAKALLISPVPDAQATLNRHLDCDTPLPFVCGTLRAEPRIKKLVRSSSCAALSFFP